MKAHLLLITVLISSFSFSQLNEGILDFQPGPSILYNFDDSTALIEIDTAAENTWQIGATDKPFFIDAYSLPNAIMTDTVNSYPTNNLSRFTYHFPFNEITTSHYFNITIEFTHKYEMDSLTEGGYIECSYNNGGDWFPIHEASNQPDYYFEVVSEENLYKINDTINNGTPAFTGTSDWTTTRLQWICFFPLKSTEVDTISLRFNFMSDSVNTDKDGWIIDDFSTYWNVLSNLNEVENINATISPNPTSDRLDINTDLSNQTGIVELVNANGQVVHRSTTTQLDHYQIDCKSFEKGAYFLILKNDDHLLLNRKVILH